MICALTAAWERRPTIRPNEVLACHRFLASTLGLLILSLESISTIKHPAAATRRVEHCLSDVDRQPRSESGKESFLIAVTTSSIVFDGAEFEGAAIFCASLSSLRRVKAGNLQIQQGRDRGVQPRQSSNHGPSSRDGFPAWPCRCGALAWRRSSLCRLSSATRGSSDASDGGSTRRLEARHAAAALRRIDCFKLS